MATNEYWLNAFYGHQGQEVPDQPDFSWDPITGEYGGPGTWEDFQNSIFPPWWGVPDSPSYSFSNFLLSNPSPCFAYSPGDTFYPDLGHPYMGDVSEGDSPSTVTGIHASGSSFISGSYPSTWWRYSPRPVVPAAFIYYRVRGTGTFKLESGLDVGSNWNWYYSDDYADLTDLVWDQESTISLETTTWTEVGVGISVNNLTEAKLDGDTYVSRFTVLSGSIEVELVEFWFASVCGYHRRTGNSKWSSLRPGESVTGTDNIIKSKTIATAALQPYSLHDDGFATSPPYIEIETAQNQYIEAVKQAVPFGGTDDWPGNYNETNGTYYASPTWSGPRDGGQEFGDAVAGWRIGSWYFRSYYGGVMGIPPHPANHMFGSSNDWTGNVPTPENSRAYRRSSIVFDFAGGTRPNLATKMADLGGIYGVSYIDYRYEEGVSNQFFGWNITGGYVSVPMSPSWPVNDRYPEGTYRLGIVPGWVVGDVLPNGQAGTTIYEGNWTAPNLNTTTQLDPPGNPVIPHPSFLAVADTSSYRGGSVGMRLSANYQTPRWQYLIPEWQYLGMYVGGS